LMLIIDEAGRFVPQIAMKGSLDIADCIGAIEEAVEWGRNYGMGITLITQRSARMNKSVSELAECMVAFQTAGPNSIASIVDWFGEHIPKERHKELVARLRKLPRGRALVVSPEWLDFEGEVQIKLADTFDSSATPRPGKSLKAPGRPTKPDLEKYRERMAATIEKARADDPNELKKQIAALRKQVAEEYLRGRTQEQQARDTVHVPHIEALQKQLTDVRASYETLRQTCSRLAESLTEASHLRVSEVALSAPVVLGIDSGSRKPQTEFVRGCTGLDSARPIKKSDTGTAKPDALKQGGEMKVLVAAAQYNGVTRDQLSVLTGYKRSSRDEFISRLKSKGLIEQSGETLKATQLGMRTLGSNFAPLPTGANLLAYWRQRLSPGERAILDAAIDVYPGSVKRDDLNLTYKRSSRDEYISRLMARKLLTAPERGSIRASSELCAW
jgi:hypothetical protein